MCTEKYGNLKHDITKVNLCFKLLYEGKSIIKLQIVIEKKLMGIMT